jgi:hypothetical protein
VAAACIATAVGIAIFMFAPARLDSWNEGIRQELCSALVASSWKSGDCHPNIRKTTELTWAWVIGNRVRVDGYGAMAYRAHKIDIVADVLAAAAAGGLTYVLLTRRSHGK